MATKQLLNTTVLVRMSRKHKVTLRRWAREADADVSKVIRGLIEERRLRESREVESREVESRSDLEPVGVAA